MPKPSGLVPRSLLGAKIRSNKNKYIVDTVYLRLLCNLIRNSHKVILRCIPIFQDKFCYKVGKQNIQLLSNIVFVREHDGSVRLCIDYRY